MLRAVCLCFLVLTTGALTTLRAQTTLAPLPIPLTSFGAAAIDGRFYVYGGHTGEAHEYFIEDQSNKLLMLDSRREGDAWQELTTNERLQGLGMVAYREDLIVIGGFSARNKQGEKQDLHSSAKVMAFNTQNKSWRDLPALPEPRSSHDAAILGNVIYVVGGWNMQGDEDTQWHTTAWSMDLSQVSPSWTKLPDPPFRRRALATVAHGGKLFAVGGMNQKGGPTKEVHIYDPSTQSWSESASLVGEKAMAGFGAAGWSIGADLIVTTYEGDILRWQPDSKSWKAAGKTHDARFFHRLLPLDAKTLVAIGGASMQSGKFLELEKITAR